MTEYDFKPGEGYPIPITYDVDTTSWTVTAALLTVDGVSLYTLTTERVDNYTWYANVTSTHTTAIAALTTKTAILKVTGTSPSRPTQPDVEEATIRIVGV